MFLAERFGNRFTGFQKGIHLRIDLAESPLAVVRRKTFDEPVEKRTPGITIGKTDDSRTLGTRNRRQRGRHVTVLAKQREHIRGLH